MFRFLMSLGLVVTGKILAVLVQQRERWEGGKKEQPTNEGWRDRVFSSHLWPSFDISTPLVFFLLSWVVWFAPRCMLGDSPQGALTSKGMNALMACANNLDMPIEDWTVGGVPITMMCHMERRKVR